MAFIIVEEIGFTIAHRLFHTRLLYRFHKIHHSFTSPVAATALYAHPLEHVLANVGPVFLGPCLMNSHITVMLMWVSLAIISTTLKHSGYYIPFNQSPGFHDAHHEYVWNGNYGMFQVADWIMGWDKVYRSKVKAKSGNLLNVPKLTKDC
jgi:methylsterol monooxygenase